MTERSRRFTDLAESKTWATSGSSTTATASFPFEQQSGLGGSSGSRIGTPLSVRHDPFWNLAFALCS